MFVSNKFSESSLSSTILNRDLVSDVIYHDAVPTPLVSIQAWLDGGPFFLPGFHHRFAVFMQLKNQGFPANN